jgi:hypothetical protein
MPRVKKTTKPKKAARPKKAAPKKAAKPTAMKKYAQRADLGAPIDGFFAKQPAQLRPILETLRDLADEAAPEAEKSLKWGMPVYTIGGVMTFALGGHKSHVKLVLAGPPGLFADPSGLLAGEGKTGRHLKVRTLDELPRDAVRGWLRAAAEHARRARS